MRATGESQKNLQLVSSLEELLYYLELCQVTDRRMETFRPGKKSRRLLPIRHFAKAEPLMNAAAYSLAGHDPDNPENDKYLIPEDALPRDLSAPLDVCFLGHPGEDGEGDPGDKFAAHRLIAIPPRRARGYVAGYFPQLIDYSVCWFTEMGGAATFRGLFGSKDGGKSWRWALKHGSGRAIQERLKDCIHIAHGIAFTRELFWAVHLGFVGQPMTLRIPTDPVGASEVFRLRDIPEGKARRQALMHWVSAHSRQSRKDPNLEIQVRKHLRGGQEFVWNDLWCRIEPNLSDAIESRQEWRLQKEAT